jgi:hypothetical protein
MTVSRIIAAQRQMNISRSSFLRAFAPLREAILIPAFAATTN